jgi:hypothetical protein
MISGVRQDIDADMELSLRPKTLDEYVGQDQVKENLRIFTEAALNRGEALDHVLLYGPPGLGKTTLANIIANEMRVNIRTTSGPAIERQGDLVAILTNLEPGDVLFIDEIHRLRRPVEVADVACLGPCFPEVLCIFEVTNPQTGQTAIYRIVFDSVQQIGITQRWCYRVSVQGDPALSHWVIELCNPPPMVTAVTRNGIGIPFNVGPQADLGGQTTTDLHLFSP